MPTITYPSSPVATTLPRAKKEKEEDVKRSQTEISDVRKRKELDMWYQQTEI